MGYYTSYHLYMQGDPKKIAAAEQDLLDISTPEPFFDEEPKPDSDVQELVDTGFVDAKLYDICDWLDTVTKKNPDVLIVLSGDGEEVDDRWESRWKGEETEFNRAQIPPFKNKNLLTDFEKINS